MTNRSTKPTLAGDASIPVSYSRLIARELQLHERDLPRLLQGTGLESSCLIDREAWLSREQQARIVRNALEISGWPELGLRVGGQLQPSTHGAIGYLALSSPDLRTALESLQDFLPDRIRFASITLHREGESLVSDIKLDMPGGPAVRRAVLEAFALLFQSVAESVVGRPIEEGRFEFDYAAPPYRAVYRNYLHSPFRFGASRATYAVPVQLAATRNVSGDHMAYALARDQCERLARQSRERSPSTKGRTRDILLSQPTGRLGETDVARALYVTPRTLARRLHREGSSFRGIRDEVLSELAAHHLLRTDLSVETIAALLGYHDAANFRRAFKRWRGVTPHVYRSHGATP